MQGDWKGIRHETFCLLYAIVGGQRVEVIDGQLRLAEYPPLVCSEDPEELLRCLDDLEARGWIVVDDTDRDDCVRATSTGLYWLGRWEKTPERRRELAALPAWPTGGRKA